MFGVCFVSVVCPVKAALYLSTIGADHVNRAVLMYEEAVWYLNFPGIALFVERQNDTFFHLLPREKLQAAFIIDNDMFFVLGRQSVFLNVIYVCVLVCTNFIL